MMTVIPHGRKELQRPFRFILLLRQGFANAQVFTAVKQDAPRTLSVTPRPPRFLIIFFQALGHIIIDDESDIRQIEAVTKILGNELNMSVARFNNK